MFAGKCATCHGFEPEDEQPSTFEDMRDLITNMDYGELTNHSASEVVTIGRPEAAILWYVNQLYYLAMLDS